jgi:hypothetical protein
MSATKPRFLGGGRVSVTQAPPDPESLKREAPVADSPKQARERAEGKKVSRTPPGITRTIVAGGRDVFELLGCPTIAPAPTEKTGMPIPREFKTRDEEQHEAEAKLRRERNPRAESPDPDRWERVHAAAAEHKAERERKQAEAERKAAAIRDTLREAGI